MFVTTEELEEHFDDYLALCQTEDLYITRDDQVIVVMRHPWDAYDRMRSRRGILPPDTDIEKIKMERLTTA